MKDLHNYLFHNVEITDNENNKISGYVDLFESADDNGTNEDSIGVIQNNRNVGLELYESEIETIRIID